MSTEVAQTLRMPQQPLRVRRLTDAEGRQLQQIVRRGGSKTDQSIVRWRRSMVVLASGGGNTVDAIARLVQTSPDRVREMIHRFNEMGMASLDPKWAGGRPRRITTDDEAFVVATATARPESVGLLFTRWSLRKLSGYLADNPTRRVVIGRERLRGLLAENDVTFQRTKTWKESNDPARDEKLDRIDDVLTNHLDRCFAFDEFGPLGIYPVGGSSWSVHKKPQRLRANFHKYAGVRQFHGCYSVADDVLFGTVRAKKGAVNTLAAIKQIRARRPDGEPMYVILDNLSAQGTEDPHLVREQRRRALLHTGLLLVGEPDRVPVRAVTRVRPQQLRPSQPSRACKEDPRVSALAQRECPSARRSRRATQRAGSDPIRTSAPLGPTWGSRSVTQSCVLMKARKPFRSGH
jgi:transposase